MTQPRKNTQKTGAHPDQSTLESSLQGLRSKDGFVRKQAREALTSVGRRAVPPLLLLLKDPVDDVRWEAAKALATIADARAVPGLVVALEDRMFGARGDLETLLAPVTAALDGMDPQVGVIEPASNVLNKLRG